MFGVAIEPSGGIMKQVVSPESAAAGDIFDQFANAQTFKSVQGTFRLLCDTLRLKPTNFPNFYPKLKAKLRSWKAQALWAKFDKRANHRCYNRGKTCSNVKVLIIGAGPCGLRAAIEAQLLGAKVVVIEKRDRLSRNNVLHLWPFVIQDLRNLGAKKFYGKFCAGAIDHISIRQLQCVLLKVALLLGVEIHENVTFDDVIEPPMDQSREKIGWKALVTPRDHPVSQYEFDVLIGADGKRNTLKGFKRKEFRGKLAIAITANFINRHSEAEARVQEISGVAFIFNQKFFTDLRDQTGIDLENIVYYKDETHYFVMTAKKYSLIEKGVILNDYADTARLLAPENVSKEALFNYAREAADFSTNFQMPHLDFAVNHYGQEDVAMFDFTSMYAAESACRVIERKGHKLLQALVGDSLLEPFWPTGSGCARGFLSSIDACWMIRSWALGTVTPLQVLAERESIYRLLAQTTPENLSKDYNAYSLNPGSRYPNLNLNAVRPTQVRNLYDTDGELKEELVDIFELPKKRRKRDSLVHPDTLLNWCQRQVILYKNVTIDNMTSSWKNGLALAAIVHRYRPDLIDFNSLTEEEGEKTNQLMFEMCEREFGIHPVMTAKEMAESQVPDALAMVSYVSQIYETFRGEIPHINRAPMVDFSPEDRPASPSRKSPIARLSFLSRLGGSKKRYSMERNDRARGIMSTMTEQEKKELERERADLLRRLKKRRSLERDRALFIMNKDTQQATLTGYKKTAATIRDRENFTTRVKDLEEKLYGVGRQQLVQSTSPNAPRVIGKLDRGDWNVRMLEEKLKGQKPNAKKERQDVPKWNRDMFEDKLRAMDQRGKGEYPVEQAKYSAFDVRLQMLDKKLKEGNNLDIGLRGSNKVSAVAGQLASILDTNATDQPLQRSTTSETCHFCGKRVYLMERQSAQNKFFHRSCFKCECCGVALHLSSYGLATVGAYSGKFLCLHHFGMRNPPRRRQSDGRKSAGETTPTRTSAKTMMPTPTTLDLPDVCSNKTRGVTPERVEFENTVEFTSEEELLSEIDEDEWTDRNFGMSANEYESSDEESDFSSDEMASENEEELAEAFQNSLTADETWKLAETWKRRYFQRRASGGEDDEELTDEEDDDDDEDEEYDESDEEYNYEEYENEDEDDDESTATEGEVQHGAGEGPSDQIALTPDQWETKTEDVCLIIPQQPPSDKDGHSTDYRALKSSGTEETGSDGVDSEGYTDSDTETESEGTPEEDADDEDEDRKRTSRSRRQHRRRRCSATIPTIVIDETTTKAPDEDDDAYFVTLQEQSLRAERTLEDLIVQEQSRSPLESAVQTPEEPQWVQEEIRPLVTCHREPEMIIIPIETLQKDKLPLKSEPIVPDQVSKDTEVATAESELTVASQRPLEKKKNSAFYVTRIPKTVSETKQPGDSKKDSSQELFSSLPELNEVKKVTDAVKSDVPATESPTAKMMLKLKEQYLLGSSDNSHKPMPIDSFPVATYDLEPTVKSCLELITEKQRMLTPVPSPSSASNVRLGGHSGDTLSSSPPPPSSSSDSFNLKLGSSSSWSKISPISLLDSANESLSQSPTKFEETHDTNIGQHKPDLCEHEAIPLSLSTTVTPDDQFQTSDSASPITVKRDNLGENASGNEEMETIRSSRTAFQNQNLEASNEGTKRDDEAHQTIDDTNCVTFASDESSSCYPYDDAFFQSIDSSNITLRKKTADESITSMESQKSEDQFTNTEDQCTRDEDLGTNTEDQCTRPEDLGTKPEDLGTKPEDLGTKPEDLGTNTEDQCMSLVDQCTKPEAQCTNFDDQNRNTAVHSIKDMPEATQEIHFINNIPEKALEIVTEKACQKPETEIANRTNIGTDNLDEIKAEVAVPQETTTLLKVAPITESNCLLVAEEKLMANLAKPEDDDSLMGMSNSSDSDAIPSLDEKIYITENAEPIAGPKVSGYAGFSERIFPFGGHGVRDSLKRSPMPFSLSANYERCGSVSVKAKPNERIPNEASVSELPPTSSSDKATESHDEIPFADDESTHDSSSSSPDKKGRFFVERRKFRRSLQRPLSMVETLLSSTSPLASESPTRRMLPDTPFTNSNMFNTPKTMKEAVDDLRQIKTVERERARKEARERARLKSDEELGLKKVDYTVLKKKYQKADGKQDLDIEEESGHRSTSSISDEECDHVDLQVDTSPSQHFPSVPSSSSPDSEVFEQDIDLASPKHEPQLPDVLEVREDSKATDVLQPNSPDVNSGSSSSNVASSHVPSTSEGTNSESNNTTSKTDHPSSYLEIDLSTEEVNQKTATDVPKTKEVTAVPSSISKKDKQKRKSFLSLFSNFGKGKEKDERKVKEKSPSPPSAVSPQGASGGELQVMQPLSPLEGNGLKVDGTPKESRFHKLRLARSKEKVKENRKEKESPSQSSKESSCSPPSSTSQLQDTTALVFDVKPQNLTTQSGDITLDRHALIASMASLSNQIHRTEKLGNGGTPQAIDDSFSDPDANNVEDASQGSSSGSAKKTKEIAEDRRKKFQKIAQRVYRQQEQKRLRMAQEIQRQLEELEVKQRDLETRGVQVEKALRGEGDAAKKDETELMQEWFQLIHAKNLLVRQEQELMVKAKELELEDRHSRLQHQLHERMAVDDLRKTPAEIEEEGQILTEMLEIVEQRDSLIALLEENRQRHQEEDKELALNMQAKGLKLLPARTQT